MDLLHLQVLACPAAPVEKKENAVEFTNLCCYPLVIFQTFVEYLFFQFSLGFQTKLS